ncbi:hypothetical protein PIB30_083884 [Stylosanthes scabra]|uniref:SKP1-like protein n=1 Tax=Stylosanthes scabra TaxID=79078 RepID=A0ABU6YRM3_9FABA|nr:hypothetical protein [Stylosanthes scabra]
MRDCVKSENDRGRGYLYQLELGAVRRDIRRTAPMITIRRITRRTLSAAMSEKTITLKTAEGTLFQVKPSIAKKLKTIQSFIDDSNVDSANKPIPLPNVFSRELSRILDYLNNHHRFRGSAIGQPNEEATRYDEEFVKSMTHEELKALVLAANYLNVNDLLEFLNITVANLIQNKSVEFVRKFFGIESDFTPEEEEKIRSENKWAFLGVDQD